MLHGWTNGIHVQVNPKLNIIAPSGIISNYIQLFHVRFVKGGKWIPKYLHHSPLYVGETRLNIEMLYYLATGYPQNEKRNTKNIHLVTGALTGLFSQRHWCHGVLEDWPQAFSVARACGWLWKYLPYRTSWRHQRYYWFPFKLIVQ